MCNVSALMMKLGQKVQVDISPTGYYRCAKFYENGSEYSFQGLRSNTYFLENHLLLKHGLTLYSFSVN